MPRPLYVPELPLLLAVLPLAVEEPLRMVGIPVEPFRMSESISADVKSTAGRFVIFDSTNTASRAEAKTAAFYGLTVIDVADLILQSGSRLQHKNIPAETGYVDAEFLGRLKTRIEKLGGLWVRLADFPFPFQSAVCRDSIPPDGRFSRLANLLTEVRKSTVQTRLTWETDYVEFVRWWEIREQIEFQVRKQDASYRITCDSTFLKFRPALELWRGNHVASFALKQGTMLVSEDGLVFRQQHERQPVGLSALWSRNVPIDRSLDKHKSRTA